MTKNILISLTMLFLAGCVPSQDRSETLETQLQEIKESEAKALGERRQDLLALLEDYRNRYPLREDEWKILRVQVETANTDDELFQLVFQVSDPAIQSELEKFRQARDRNQQGAEGNWKPAQIHSTMQRHRE